LDWGLLHRPESAIFKAEGKPHQTEFAVALILDSPVFVIVRNKFALFINYPFYGIFVVAALKERALPRSHLWNSIA
jgi:hypothetical protein